jgi:hypothetical protein
MEASLIRLFCRCLGSFNFEDFRGMCFPPSKPFWLPTASHHEIHCSISQSMFNLHIYIYTLEFDGVLLFWQFNLLRMKHYIIWDSLVIFQVFGRNKLFPHTFSYKVSKGLIMNNSKDWDEFLSPLEIWNCLDIPGDLRWFKHSEQYIHV